MNTEAQWPSVEGMNITQPARDGETESRSEAETAEGKQRDGGDERAVRAEPALDAHAMEDALAAMQANKEARHEAQARGAPRDTVAAVLTGTAVEAPDVPGWGRPCRMTAAIRQIMLKWSKLPMEDRLPDMVCLMYCFLRPRDAWAWLEAFDERTLTWENNPVRGLWKSHVMRLALDLTEMDPCHTEALASWMTERIEDFFGRPAVTPAPMNAGTPPPPAVAQREAGRGGGCEPFMESLPYTPLETSALPCGTLT